MSYIDDLAKGIGYKHFADYLHGDDWQNRKRLHLDSKCYCCDGQKGLNTYHKTHVRLGKEAAGDVVTVCGKCLCEINKVKKDIGQEKAPQYIRNTIKQRKRKDDQKEKEFEFVSLSEIALEMRGESISSVIIVLTENELIRDAKPTEKAFDLGFAEQRKEKFYWHKKSVKKLVNTSK